MDQIHKRFTAEQVKVLLMGYCQGILDRPAIEETLGISRSTFFLLLKEYRRNPDEFSLVYHRETPTRIPAWVENEIEAELRN
jgi:predicted DNA-binding transcriptional regulator AlpA